MSAPPCRILDWDSEFFGLRIGTAEGERLTANGRRDLQRWCHEADIDCLYFLADPDDLPTTHLAGEAGFRLVDVRMTLTRDGQTGRRADDQSTPVIRAACESDLDRLAAFARVSHRDTRFFFDPGFPDAACERLYETWIRKSCAGYAQAVLVAGAPGEACGYAACHLDGSGARIGLVGVAEAARGAGSGQALVQAALGWFAENGAPRVSVVTQGRNAAAQRLYARCGFAVESMRLWYHYWPRAK